MCRTRTVTGLTSRGAFKHPEGIRAGSRVATNVVLRSLPNSVPQ